MSCSTCARIRRRLAEVAARARDRARRALELRRKRKRALSFDETIARIRAQPHDYGPEIFDDVPPPHRSPR